MANFFEKWGDWAYPFSHACSMGQPGGTSLVANYQEKGFRSLQGSSPSECIIGWRQPRADDHHLSACFSIFRGRVTLYGNLNKMLPYTKLPFVTWLVFLSVVWFIPTCFFVQKIASYIKAKKHPDKYNKNGRFLFCVHVWPSNGKSKCKHCLAF